MDSAPLAPVHRRGALRMHTFRSLHAAGRTSVYLAAAAVAGATVLWCATHRQSADAHVIATVDFEGTITLDSEPLTASRISLTRESDGYTLAAEIRDGAFRIANVPIGEWSLRIEGDSVPAIYGSGLPQKVTPDLGPIRFGLKGHETLAATLEAYRSSAMR